MPDVPYYVRKLRELLPGATITTQHDVAALVRRRAADVDAFALPAERGSAWTLRIRLLRGRAGTGSDQGAARLPDRQARCSAGAIREYVDRAEAQGRHLDAAYQHWILGHDATPARPRWSIVRDVLHWME